MYSTSIKSPARSFAFVGDAGTGVFAARVAATIGAGIRVFSLEGYRRGMAAEPRDPLIVDGHGNTRDTVAVIREARASNPSLPILFVADDIGTVPTALGAGASDFILTTATPAELAIRLGLLAEAAVREPAAERRIGALRLERETRTLSVGDRSVQLTPIEMQVFERLAKQVGQAVPRAELERSIWGYTNTRRQTSNVAVVYVSYLRGKLSKLGGVCWVSTFPKLGYALELRDAVEQRARSFAKS